MRKNKIVDNYELLENTLTNQDGIEIYKAQNIVLKEMFTIKKLNAKETTNRANQKYLTNEVSILRLFQHPNIVKCHKMLTTPNNFYLVFDNCQGQKLEEFINSSSVSDQLKLSIVKELISVLQAMKEATVVHTNLNPAYIYISPKGSIKITNFLFAHELKEKKQIYAKFKPAFSTYLPPELDRENIIYHNSDIYSLGSILFAMKITDVKLPSSKGQVANLIERMLSEQCEERPTIQEISQFFFPQREKSTKSKGKGKMDTISLKKRQNSNSISKAKTQTVKSQRNLKKNNSQASLQSQSNMGCKQFIQSIIKRRNLVLFLIELSETCFKGPQTAENLNVVVGYMLLKKSTNVLEGLYKYLKGQKIDDIEIQVNDKDRKKYEKTSDFMKLITIISKEAMNQKKWVEQIKKNIYVELKLQFKQISERSSFSDEFLKDYIMKYLRYLVVDDSLKGCEKKTLVGLGLMSWITQFPSYETMFSEIISENKIILEDQELYKEVADQKEDKIRKDIMTRVKKR